MLTACLSWGWVNSMKKFLLRDVAKYHLGDVHTEMKYKNLANTRHGTQKLTKLGAIFYEGRQF